MSAAACEAIAASTRALLPGHGRGHPVDRRRRVGARDRSRTCRGTAGSCARPSPAIPARAAELGLALSGLFQGVRIVDADGKKMLERGARFLDLVVGGRAFDVSVDSFFQGNRFLAPTLFADVLAAAGSLAPGTALDAFGGVGLFAGALSEAGHGVVSVEADAEAVVDARRTEGALEGRRALADRGPHDPRAVSPGGRSALCVRRRGSPADGARRGAGARPRAAKRSALPLRLLRSRDARARPAGDSRGRLPDPRRPAVRPLRPDPPGRGADRPRAGGVIRPVLAEGEAPAARAAVCLVLGIFLGAWSIGGAPGAAALAGVAALALAALGRPGRRSAALRLAFVAFWLAAGFLLGRARIAARAEAARAAFARTSAPVRQAAVLEGMLTDFWSGEPPRAPHDAARRAPLAGGRLDSVSGRGRRVRLGPDARPARGGPGRSRACDRPPRARGAARLRAGGPAAVAALPHLREERADGRAGAGHVPHAADVAQSLPLLAAAGGAGPGVRARRARAPRGPPARPDLGARSGDGGPLPPRRALSPARRVGPARRARGRSRRLRACRCSAVGGKPRDALLLASVFLFVLVGGANPPAVRAGLVVAIFLATRLLERPITGAQAIGLSALVLFAALPEQIFSVGTVLTFAAVCGIALFAKPIRERLPERPEWLFSGLAVALAAECATAPVLFWRFNLVAAGAWMTAPLSIPLSGALIGLGAALLALLCGRHPRGTAGRALRPGQPAARAARGAGRRLRVPAADARALGDGPGRAAARRGRRSGRRGLACRPRRARRPCSSRRRFPPAPAARRAAFRSKRSTSARETRYSCAGIAGRYSWTGEGRST